MKEFENLLGQIEEEINFEWPREHKDNTERVAKVLDIINHADVYDLEQIKNGSEGFYAFVDKNGTFDILDLDNDVCWAYYKTGVDIEATNISDVYDYGSPDSEFEEDYTKTYNTDRLVKILDEKSINEIKEILSVYEIN